MNIKEILFWIFLVLSLILLLWIVFGNSPDEFTFIITIAFTLLLKIWSISDRQIISEMKINSLDKNIRNSFIRMKRDIGLIKDKLKIK